MKSPTSKMTPSDRRQGTKKNKIGKSKRTNRREREETKQESVPTELRKREQNAPEK